MSRVPDYQLRDFKYKMMREGKNICSVCKRKEAKLIHKHGLVNSYFCGYKCLANRFISAYNIKIEKINNKKIYK